MSIRSAIIIYSNPNCLVIFPVSFIVSKSRWTERCRRQLRLMLLLVNFGNLEHSLRARQWRQEWFVGRMLRCAMCVRDRIGVRNIAPARTIVVQSLDSQPNAETQLSIAVNCMANTNRSTKVLRTSLIRSSVCSSESVNAAAGGIKGTHRARCADKKKSKKKITR